MSKELPGEWGELLAPKGVHSYRDFEAATDVGRATLHRLINGVGNPSPATINAIADNLFAGDRDLVWRLAGKARRDFGDWKPPAGTSLLTPRQREALTAVIAAMLPDEREEVMGNAEHPAPTSATADRPAPTSGDPAVDIIEAWLAENDPDVRREAIDGQNDTREA